MKNLVALLIIATSTLLAIPSMASDLNTVINSTVVLNSYTGNESNYRCSAVFIAPTVILTAAHCNEGDNYTVGIPLKEYEAKPILVDKKDDIMVLVVKDYVSADFVDVFSVYPKANMVDVTSVCYFGSDDKVTLSTGSITGEDITHMTSKSDKNYSQDIKGIFSDIQIKEGCSGGGLYFETSPGDYKLISVTSGLTETESFFTYPDFLHNVLAKAQSLL